jgi:hypothetical protein
MNLYNLLGKIEKSIRTNNITESLETLTGKSISEFEIIRVILDDHITKMK